MKARFANIDIVAGVRELQELIGLRVTNVYDVDHKVYLFKFAKPDSKVVLLVESGIRFHTTEFEWPKNNSPSGFAMKLRKHIRNRRLENVRQLGVDRIIDMQFGSREASYHVLLELYDRGNLILTDFEYNVLNILRPRTDQDTDVRYAVHEKYPLELAKKWLPPPGEKQLREIFSSIQAKDQLKKILNTKFFYGSALVEHALLSVGLAGNQKVNKDTDFEAIIPKLLDALQVAENLYKQAAEKISPGYITYRVEEKLNGEAKEECKMHDEFHPYFFLQLKEKLLLEKSSFLVAVDEFYSSIESQKLDLNILDQQKQALKKLENVQKDHERRLQTLRTTQEKEKLQAKLIEENVELVDRIIVYMRTLMAAELSWPDVAEMLERRRERGDGIAESIVKADIARNTVTVALDNKTEGSEDEDVDDVVKVEILLNQSAFQNITRLHAVKKQAAAKENKTIEASAMALKNAERKTKQALKDVAIIGSITKARKVQWFEKFFWFISSDKFLVIGGRDAQQNEMLVKRYMKANDVYVHADLHGASSVIIKNHAGEVPPKTLNEAGVMAISYSNAWEAKVPAKAWWVYSHQVSKTAPTGEYLGMGSFMIRGKKNFFPPLTMIMGFGILFKIDEESVRNHVDQTEKSETDSLSVPADAGEEEDMALDIEDADSTGEAENKEVDEFPEPGDGVNLIKALASKIISTSEGAEENTLITATLSGVFPKAKPPQQRAKAQEKGRVLPPGQWLKEADEKLKAVDDNDWSDYKKKGKNPRPPKNYNRKYQELPTKVPKKTAKPDQPESIESVSEMSTEIGTAPEVFQDTGGDVQPEVSSSDKTEDPRRTDSRDLDEEKAGDDERDEEDDIPAATTDDLDVFSTLVSSLDPNDNCLFCIPVCAPYNAMQNYKFKVKLLPGTAKRGKAAKACFQSFMKEKTLTTKEKDVLKSIKDQDCSRNFPGNVKLAVTQQKFKQRKK